MTAFSKCLIRARPPLSKGDIRREQLGVNARLTFYRRIPIRQLSVDGFSAVIDYVVAGGADVRSFR